MRSIITNVFERLLAQQHDEVLARYDHLVVFGLLIGVLAAFFLAHSGCGAKYHVDAPLVGKRWLYEPTVYTRTRFFKEAWPIIHEGFTKVGLCR